MSAYDDMSLVQALINTHDLYLEEPEHLRTPHDLERFLADHHFQPQEKMTQDHLEAVRQFRDQLRAIWSAPTLDDMIRLLNALFSRTKVTVQLEREKNEPVPFINLHLESDESIIQQVSIRAALGILRVIQVYGVERMRACEAAPCRDVFIDLSRNKSRRFCSDRCANRYNIAAFRERHQNKPAP